MDVGELYIYALFYKGSRGTDRCRRAVRGQEVAMRRVSKQATLKDVLPS